MTAHRERRIGVIGGGPSGAICARRLAERGLDVTLFEPRTHFEKPCGGGMSARGFERFPFLETARLPVRRVGRCLVIAPSGREADIRLQDPLFVFSRADLHTLLLENAIEAGARLVRRRVVALTRGSAARGRGTMAGAGFQLDTVVDGRREAHGLFDYLVAADGASGPTRRWLTGRIDRRSLTQGIGYYVPDLVEEWITLKFFAGLRGYLWIFPRIDHSSAGICGPLGPPGVAPLQRRMDDFLTLRYGQQAIERSQRYAALIPGALGEAGAEDLTGPGWALTGDGCRAVDPITSEGIYYAMLSGELLADLIAEGRAGQFTHLWSRRVADEFDRAARMAPTFFDRRFIEMLVLLCGRSRAIGDTLSDLMAGRQGYRGLKRRLLRAAPVVGWQLLRPLRKSSGPRNGPEIRNGIRSAPDNGKATAARDTRSIDRLKDGSARGDRSPPDRGSEDKRKVHEKKDDPGRQAEAADAGQACRRPERPSESWHPPGT